MITVLPPLPPRVGWSGASLYCEDQMREYGKACWDAGREQAEKSKPQDDNGNPIVYDTEEIDEVAHSLTGDEGEDDSVTVLKGLARYVENVWPGKTALEVLLGYETEKLDAARAIPEGGR